MPRKFVLNLNQIEWQILDRAAQQKGYKDFQDYVPDLLESLKKDNTLRKNYSCQDVRIRKNFDIPAKAQKNCINLGCKVSTSISAAIFRFLILPLLIEESKGNK